MLIMYSENLIKTDLFGKIKGLDVRALKINERIEQFITSNPLNQCSDEIESKRFECSLIEFKKRFIGNE